ncbi:MAG: BrnT family toxin [Fibrobacterota bacterium]
MTELEFSWNSKKADINLKKHKVSFDEAVTVFYDEFATEFYDNTHSDDEDRFLLLGHSSQLRILIVCHCTRNDNIIRIISARKATKNESKYYRRTSR